MNIREPSTHLFREKSENKLEDFLVDFGAYRRWGVNGLSTKRKSPASSLNKLCRDLTDECDRDKRKKIRDKLKREGWEGEKLTSEAKRQYAEWLIYINALPVPRETQKVVPIDPDYGGNRYYSRINIVLKELNDQYYRILIYKYEHEWELKDFMREWGKPSKWVSDKLYRARRDARKLLRKNGYKV